MLMYKLDCDYMQVPADLNGEGISVTNINIRAFGRTLDDLFNLDLTQTTFDIYETLERRYRFLEYIYNIDSTNFSVTMLTVEPDAIILQKNGHAKNGDKSKLI